MIKHFYALCLLIVIAVFYQNCGAGFQSNAYNSLSSSSNLGNNSFPNTDNFVAGSEGGELANNLNLQPNVNIPLTGNWKLVFNEEFNGNGNMRNYSTFDLDPMLDTCLLYTSPSPRDQRGSRMPSSA